MIKAAVEAAPVIARWSGAQRRDVLHAIADALAAETGRILDVVSAETGLTTARLTAELDRTTGQLRLLGDYVAAGRHVPQRRGDGFRQIVVPLGPVAVFAASNFPLAFGIPGGDFGSALAAGCPVVVKAHPAQPQTSRLLAGIVQAHLPSFVLVEGGNDVSVELVTSPGIKAVGFTGSLAGGRALLNAVATRPDPIPVYAEMGSINPVFVLPAAAKELARAQTLAAAVTGSCGQLCTKPGLVVVDSPQFASALAETVAATPVHRMLTPGMEAAHTAWRKRAPGTVVEGSGLAFAILASVAEPELLEEHFGPSVVVLSTSDYGSVASALEGQLTATIHAAPGDEALAAELLPLLAAKAGRIVWNGVPTGVAVNDAMLHGGPWPATSAPSSTSVGTAAIERFQRPVVLQGVPEHMWPSRQAAG